MDWKTRIERLLAADVPLKSIADEMGVTPNAVREVIAERSKSPRADAAIRLLDLYARTFPEAAHGGEVANAA